MRTILSFFLVISITVAYCQTDKIGELVDEGVAYHDNEDYDKAIRKYKEALKLDPESALANFEIALTYLTIKDYQRSFEHSKKVIRAGGEHLEGAYILNGTALDHMGKQKEALDVYQEGLEQFPESYLICYNLGLTAYNYGSYDLCYDVLKTGLQVNPFHNSSHNLMGQLMYTSCKARSILAFTYYLLLSPDNPNAKTFFDLVANMLEGGKNIKTEASVNIGVPYNDTTDHITFAAAELGIGFIQATIIMEEKEGKNDFDYFANNLNTFLTLLGELRDNQNHKGFWWDYYVNFFYELAKAGYGKTLAFFISQSAHNKIAKQWMAEHEQEVDNMITWISDYYKR